MGDIQAVWESMTKTKDPMIKFIVITIFLAIAVFFLRSAYLMIFKSDLSPTEGAIADLQQHADTIKELPVSKPLKSPSQEKSSKSVVQVQPKITGKNIVTAPNFGNQQVGDGNTMNVNSEPELTEEMKAFLLREIPIKQRELETSNEIKVDFTNGANVSKLHGQVIDFLLSKGYNVVNFSSPATIAGFTHGFNFSKQLRNRLVITVGNP